MNRDRRKHNQSADQRAGRGRGRGRSKATEGPDRRAFIGRHRNVSDLAETYRDLSGDDEHAAIVLQREGQYRQAVYFCLQAMEKLARYAVFSEVGPDDASIDGQTYRERTRTHNLDELLTVLLEAYKETINDSRVSEQIEQQMEAYVLQGQYFGVLHNDVRYPRYIERRQSDALLELNEVDAVAAADKLARLKAFVAGFQQLKGLRSGEAGATDGAAAASPESTPVWDFKF